MIVFKKIETILQALAALVVLFLIVAFQNRISFDNFIPAYLIIGGYQLLSVLINAFLPFRRSPLRKIYFALLGLVLICGIIFGFAGDQIIGYLFVMLFFTPAMALFYLFICYQETYRQQQPAVIQQPVAEETASETSTLSP